MTEIELDYRLSPMLSGYNVRSAWYGLSYLTQYETNNGAKRPLAAELVAKVNSNGGSTENEAENYGFGKR